MPLLGAEALSGHDTSGPTTDDAMTRSEDQLHIGTEKQAAAGAGFVSTSPRMLPADSLRREAPQKQASSLMAGG